MTGTEPIPRFYADYRIRFDEAGPDGLLRGSSLLGIVQDAAWQHSESVGLTREWYAERRLLWLVRAVDLRILAPVAHGETVRAETMIDGYRRVLARRLTRIARPDGTPVAVARTDWVMTSLDGGPTRIVDGIVARFPGAGSFESIRLDRSDPPSGAVALSLSTRLRDIDPVAHMNNGVYLDILDESVDVAGGDLLGTYPRRTALEYVDAAIRGDALTALAWRTPEGWAHRLERAEDGATLVRGSAAAGAGPA